MVVKKIRAWCQRVAGVHRKTRHQAFFPCRLGLTLLLSVGSIGWMAAPTFAHPRTEQSPSQLCSNNQPVTNECVEDGLRKQRETLRALPEFQADTPESHAKLAGILMQQGDPNGAIEEYQATIRLNPKMAEAFREMGAVYLDKHEWERAEDALFRSVALDEADSQAHYWLGRALLAQQHFPEATQALLRSTLLDGQTAEVFSDLALAQMAQGHIREAEDALYQAISLKPDFADAHHRLEILRYSGTDPDHLMQATKKLLGVYFRRE